MSSEYTPTTTDVIYAYRVAGTIGPAEYPQRALAGLRYQAEFDRWLAAHDLEIRREIGEQIARMIEAYAFTEYDEASTVFARIARGEAT